MKKTVIFLSNHKEQVIFIGLIYLSLFTFAFYSSNNQHLLYADAMSRLNIARKVVDNLTPGFAQVGNVWLPLPQMLMVPFIWNDYLWQSGFAGSLMSMTAFVLGGYFIYKAAFLISKSVFSSVLAMSIYALNINVLYLQTTAMSESLFLCTLSASIYYSLNWVVTRNRMNLVPFALALSAMTFTRYEGLALLLAAIPTVFVYSWLIHRRLHKAEGELIIFTTLALLGFGLWTLYLTAIFGDPLFWMHYYATPQATGGAVAYSQQKPFLAAVWQYTTSTIWMDGLVPVVFAIIGFFIALIHSIKTRILYILPLALPLSIFLFMVLTLQRNTPIVQPALTVASIYSPLTSMETGFNVRYGLLLLPLVAVLSVYVFMVKNHIIKLLIFGFFCIQIYSYFSPRMTLIYHIPMRVYDKPYGSLVAYMKEHYDEGYILISASSHEDQMFLIGLPYKTYIHEGAGKYWKESLDDPARYATWVVVDRGHPEDQLNKHLNNKPSLDRDFHKVHVAEQIEIYRIKDKPWLTIDE